MIEANTTFTRGGKVQAGGGLYIKRKADDELLRVCRAGEIGIVLHSRQVGKSSLIGNVSSILHREGIATVVVDLTRIGTMIDHQVTILRLLAVESEV